MYKVKESQIKDTVENPQVFGFIICYLHEHGKVLHATFNKCTLKYIVQRNKGYI